MLKKRIVILSAVFFLIILSFAVFPVANKEDKPAGILNLSSSYNNSYLRAIDLGGKWFLNNQNKNFIFYKYDYIKGEHSKGHHALREAASLWAITKLHQYSRDPSYEKLANRGIKYFESYFEYDKNNNFYILNITPDKMALGYSAMIVLSLIGVEHPKKEEYLSGFARGILSQQKKNGELKSFFYSEPGSGKYFSTKNYLIRLLPFFKDKGKNYYPGEALLSLMYLYEYSHNETYLNAVGKALPFYIKYFKWHSNNAFVPWNSQAYYKYYEHTHSQDAKNFVFDMNDFLIKQHHPKGDCTGFDFSSGIVTAVYMEGMNSAYALANETGDMERQRCYKNFIKEGTDFILTLQITNATYGKSAIGGFIRKKGESLMRVDQNQHAVMALMTAYELGILK